MSREVARYGVYLADLNPSRGAEIAKTRPVVIVSQDAMNRNLDTVVVCPLTSRLHVKWRSRIQMSCAGRRAEIAADQIRAITKERLSKKIDQLEPSAAAQLRQLITEMYGE